MNAALRLVTEESEIKKDYINHTRQLEPKYGVLFTDFVNETVSKKVKRMGPQYRRSYNSLIRLIEGFSYEMDCNIYTNSVNEEFLDDFIMYLENRNLKSTYIKTLIDLTKAMIRKAGNYGFAVDPTWESVTVEADEPFAIYLSMNEITRIYYFKGLTRKQERIKDLFIVGCLTALRYSDYSTLTKENFQNDYIIKITKKTGKKVIVPIHDYVREIFNRYEGEISSGLSIQHFNRYIKMICKKVGMTDLVTYNFTRGGKLCMETKQKWELVSSHTARRSAATNLYNTQRMKTNEIMQLTGHTTESSFFKYIKTTTDDKAKQIAGDSFFRK